MIRVFVSDIDGCLSEPYRPFDLPRMAELRDVVARGNRREVPDAPPDFSICTGRSYGYLEALTQVLDVRVPVLFEAGGGLFDPGTATTRWNPVFTPDLDLELASLRAWIGDRILGTSLSIDLGKRTQAGVIGPVEAEVRALAPQVREHVEAEHPGLVVATTPVSIDVLDRRLTKRAGLAWLADELAVRLDEMAFVGDTEGDLGGLAAVGYSFAPANAAPAVRSAVQTVTSGSTIRGVIEAYLACAIRNRG